MNEMEKMAFCESSIGSYQRPSITERLESRKVALEQDLGQINKSLELLKENPKLQELFDAVSKVGF